MEEGRISGGWAEYVLLHSYTGTVMKEQGGWHLLPVLSFYEWSKLNARPNLAMFHGAPLSVCVESVRSQNRETPKRGIFMLIERRFPSISPILSALSLSLSLCCGAAMSIHLADGPESLTCGGNNYCVYELNLGYR